MNKLENFIIEGAINAQAKYQNITDGYWLWHGPESFLQVMVADYISTDAGHAVYIDASIKKVNFDIERGPGRPGGNSKQRPDISIWNKSSNTLRAAIEIKRTWNISLLRSDAARMRRWTGQVNGPTAVYLLVYTEAVGKSRVQTIERRFRHWADTLSWTLLTTAIHREGESGWSWGICLLRYAK